MVMKGHYRKRSVESVTESEAESFFIFYFYISHNPATAITATAGVRPSLAGLSFWSGPDFLYSYDRLSLGLVRYRALLPN